MQLETPGQTKAPVSSPANPEITNVSAVDPVYSDVDRREPHTLNVIGQEDTGAYEVLDPLPRKGQHATMSTDSVGGANDNEGVDLTRNEAYGLLQNVIWNTPVYKVSDPLPMQGQQVTRNADSVGEASDKDEVDLSRNEA